MNKRLIKIAVSISFLLLLLMGCAYQKSESAGRVNGVYIKTQDFMNSMRGHFTGFMLEKDRTPDEAEKRELYKSTWRDITIHVILRNYFEKYKIMVTQKEVMDSLLTYVPLSVQKAPLFQTNGIFDKDKYVQSLLNDRTGQLDWLKQHYFNYYVPLQKLKLELQDNEVISTKELSHLHKIMNNAADVSWIVFDPATSEVKVSQADIETYYHSHLDKYQINTNASFGWVAVPTTLSQDDIEAAKTRIDSIYFELSNGKSFTVLAERFSQSSTSKSGGSLGFLQVDELSSNVRQALEGLDKNGITRPLKLDNYWGIYQLVERTKNLVKLNEIIIEIIPGEVNRMQTKDTAIHLRDLGLQLNLETAAREMNYPYKRSGIVTKDSLWLKDSNLSAYLIDRAFTQKAGALLEPVYSEIMRAWIVAEIITVQPFKYKSVATVSDEIHALLQAEKQKSRALEQANIWAQANKKQLLDAAAKSALPIVGTSDLRFDGFVNAVPVNNVFVTIMDDFQKKNLQKSYLVGDKVLIPVVTKLTALNPEQFSHSNVRQYYFEYINPSWFDKWLDTQIKNAKVDIWFAYPM